MICDHCGQDYARMEGTVKRCFCGLWIETQPEVDDDEALKQYCQGLSVERPVMAKRSNLTPEELKAHVKEYNRKYREKHREELRIVDKARYALKKQQRAA